MGRRTRQVPTSMQVASYYEGSVSHELIATTRLTEGRVRALGASV